MYAEEIKCKSVDWIQMAMNTIINFRAQKKARYFLTRSVTISFSRTTLLHGFGHNTARIPGSS
jgi:hypothetical protein